MPEELANWRFLSQSEKKSPSIASSILTPPPEVPLRMESSGVARLLGPANHQLRFRLIDGAHRDRDSTWIAKDPAPGPPGSRLIATWNKADPRVWSASERNASDQTGAGAIRRRDHYLDRLPAFHDEWSLGHQDRASDVPLLESRKKRIRGLLSGSEVTSSSIYAEPPRRSCFGAPVACAGPSHRARAPCGHAALGNGCLVY